MKYKIFFIIFEGLSLKQIKKKFLEGESPALNFYCDKISLYLQVKERNYCNMFFFS